MKQSIFKKIISARVYDAAERTPLDFARNLSEKTGNQVYLKREDLQTVFSFKIRGAYNRIAHLTEAEKAKGIICASAGNHAQGTAYSAKKLGIPAIIVMPTTTPQIKVNAVRQFGVQVELQGDNYSEAAAYCAKRIEETGTVFIHPFDDEYVIAGQGTVGHELLTQCPDLDVVFVPVGGGGLISGIAAFFKEIKPDVKIIGVEPVDSMAMAVSVQENKRVELDKVGIFADGVAVKQVGNLTFELCRENVDEWIQVSTDELCSAIKSIYEDTRSIVEPAGALGVAGLKKWLKANPVKNKNLAAVNSGANMNFERLQFVAERTLIGEHREALYAVELDEKPGEFKKLCEKAVGERNVTEFNYRLMGRKKAHVFVGVSVDDTEKACSFQESLNEYGFTHTDLTDNELAKAHVRHMVGGRSADADHEVLFRFYFPERPKALTDFLSALSESWNISLFHYRSHGGDFGRVLVGFEIPDNDKSKFEAFLNELHYPYVDETENEAYRLFL